MGASEGVTSGTRYHSATAHDKLSICHSICPHRYAVIDVVPSNACQFPLLGPMRSEKNDWW